MEKWPSKKAYGQYYQPGFFQTFTLAFDLISTMHRSIGMNQPMNVSPAKKLDNLRAGVLSRTFSL
jgi:hypothetical protein